MIDPNNTLSSGPASANFRKEVEFQLSKNYELLLNDSADQLLIVERLLVTLGRYDVEYAMQQVQKLNTVDRRDRATRKVLIEYVSDAAAHTDPVIVAGCLSDISEQEHQDITIVHLLKTLSNVKSASVNNIIELLLRKTERMYSSVNKCFAYGYALRIFDIRSNVNRSSDVISQLRGNLELIDSKWEKVNITLSIADLVAEHHAQLAIDLLREAQQQRDASLMNNEVMARAYLVGLRLMSRAVGSLSEEKDGFPNWRQSMLERIRRVPSVAEQVRLVSDLALRCYIGGQRDVFFELMKSEVIPSLDVIQDVETYHQILVDIAPAMYEYDALQWKSRIGALSALRRDKALYHATYYLLSGLPMGEPVDLESPRIAVEARRVREIVQLIPLVTSDVTVYRIVDRIVTAVVRPTPNNPHRERVEALIERDVLDITAGVEREARAKLPDSKNISHEGFLVIIDALLTRLRLASVHRSSVVPAFAGLVSRARAIPNAADRAFVLAAVGEAIYRVDEQTGRSLLQSAEAEVGRIPNLLDRAERFQSVAEAWRDVNAREAAKVVLGEAMVVAGALSSLETRDRMIGQISELAHSVDPDFAEGLMSSVEDPWEAHQARLKLRSQSLKVDPAKITTEHFSMQYERGVVLSDAAWSLLKGLNSGTVGTRDLREVSCWLLEAAEGRFEGAAAVAVWAVENAIRVRNSASFRLDLFSSLDRFLHVLFEFGSILTDAKWQYAEAATAALSDGMKVFMAGSRVPALASVEQWLAREARDYVKIYDPFFSVSDLPRLQSAPPDCNVYVVTSWKAQKGLSPGDRIVEERFREEWRGITSSEPPWTQITVMGTKSGESPLHNRYIVSSSGGLRLSTSLSGIGSTDTELNLLTEEEAREIESVFVNPQLGPQTRVYRGEELLVRVFML
jgi:hypothetical protein